MPKHHKGSTGVCQAYNGKNLVEFTLLLKIIFFRVLCTYTMYICHIIYLSPVPTSALNHFLPSFISSFYFLCYQNPSVQLVLPICTCRCPCGHLPGQEQLTSICLPKSDSPSFTSYQLPIAPLIRVGPQPS